MSSSEAGILDQGRQWLRAGQRVVLATVAHTWGSSPRQPGAVMVIAEDGRFAGSVSGGCIEDELLARLRGAFPPSMQTLEYASDTTRALPCGGRLLLVLEPLAQEMELATLADAMRARQNICRHIDLAHARADFAVAKPGESTHFDNDRLTVLYESDWRLLVIGAGELASWVCKFAAQLGYVLDVCDPREEYRVSWPLTDIPVSAAMPDDHIAVSDCDPQTAIVALTHDPKVDDLAMMEALATPAFYIGALGSPRTTASRAQRLMEHFDTAEEEVRRIRGPIGMDLNTRKPAEIALAVMSDITAVKNGVRIATERTAKAAAEG